MNYTTTINPILDALNNGHVIRRAFTIFLKVLAGLWVILGLAMVIGVLRFSFNGDAMIIVAGILIAALVIIYSAISIQILLYRSRSIGELEESPFTIIPIISIWFRLIGELYAAFILFASISGLLAIAITGQNFLGYIMGDYLPLADLGGETFLGGLLLLVSGVVAAFVIIMIAYWLAESTLIFADIAINIRKLTGQNSEKSFQQAQAKRPEPETRRTQPEKPPQAPPKPQNPPAPPRQPGIDSSEL